MRLLTTLLILFLATTSAYAEITTVILVRHAEKVSADDDPPLSKAGLTRAQELVRVLADTKIDAIYSTQYKRTRDTAAPIAEKMKIDSEIFPATKTFAADMAKLILWKHRGETVLVVGHSNTTRDVARALGFADAPDIADPQYDHLLIGTIAGDERELVVLRYGAPTP